MSGPEDFMSEQDIESTDEFMQEEPQKVTSGSKNVHFISSNRPIKVTLRRVLEYPNGYKKMVFYGRFDLIPAQFITENRLAQSILRSYGPGHYYILTWRKPNLDRELKDLYEKQEWEQYKKHRRIGYYLVWDGIVEESKFKRIKGNLSVIGIRSAQPIFQWHLY